MSSVSLINEAFTWSTRAQVPTAAPPDHSPAARKRRRRAQEKAAGPSIPGLPTAPLVQGW